MKNSRQLAALIGPTLMAMTASEALNAEIWADVTPAQTYLAGTLWFVSGLSIIRAHNIWVKGWIVLITITGWFAMIGGLGRMFFPASAQAGAQNEMIVLAVQVCLFLTGLVLSYKAYMAKRMV